MRLTHLKLAGFKSFVDPTTLHVHGQRIGIVGPNGCGKSNVMESVRWVLGESSAKEMRGDSMQDVIFNGSGNRKPVSRASVELIFDNSLGGAAGEWSQYAEISVKRVLQRDSGSTYYINNTPVRRRDVGDLFLGTGLGGRAYAIIGQNTISRIVEARPEELRVFLEEAAGISKYKERRRETELRLRDTRDNLTRVEDIRRELGKQIERLESQALVAQQYHDLLERLGLAQAQYWLLKKRDAAQGWEKSRRQVERLVNDLEAQTAALRKVESELEQLRLQQHAGSEAVQAEQGRYYEANARVSALEQKLLHMQENRERLSTQLSQMLAEQEKASMQLGEFQRQLEQQRDEQVKVAAAVAQSQQGLESMRAQLPQAEQSLRDSQAQFSQVQNGILQAEQQIQLERTHIEHAGRSQAELGQRLQRLQEEESRLAVPDSAQLVAREHECSKRQAGMEAIEADLKQLALNEQVQAEALRSAHSAVQQGARQLAQVEAQLAALQKLQQALGHEGKLDAWLRHNSIDGGKRLWQFLKAEPGSETALEGLLGNRLNSVFGAFAHASERPPAAVVLCEQGGEAGTAGSHPAGWRALSECVAGAEPQVRGVLADWLANAWLLPDGADMASARKQLRAGEALVNVSGDVATRYSVSIYAAQSGLHGVLERQRELEQLEAQLPELKLQLQRSESGLQQQEADLHELRRNIAAKQHQLHQETSALHAARMEVQRLHQQLQHVRDRHQSLSAERERLGKQQAETASQQQEREILVQEFQARVETLRQEREHAGKVRDEAEATLRRVREAMLLAERNAQQQAFAEKLILNNINELVSKVKVLDETISFLHERQQEAQSHLAGASTDTLKADLEQALAIQRQNEQALLLARNQMAGIEQQLLEAERSRMQNEQALHPLRDKLEQARLQEQQARLYFEQCGEQLAATGKDESVLEQGLDKSARSGDLERAANSLKEEIDALGPVNLAAIQELAGERERKQYLDSQATDLEQAVLTLEEAIRRIDRETRSRLQQTYDEANRHFGELFITLFGGGQAQLQLLGDEILDTGVQVFAQPPGKKNSTIHLLSGGEKALTALALVFALFRLNPAPFCLMDEVDAPLDDSNTERFCSLVRKMSERTQFLIVSHNKITMEMAQQLIGVTMQESGVSRIVEVDIEAAQSLLQ